MENDLYKDDQLFRCILNHSLYIGIERKIFLNNFMMKTKLISKLGEDFEVTNSSKN